jgi:hypothetical protein
MLEHLLAGALGFGDAPFTQQLACLRQRTHETPPKALARRDILRA